VHRITSSKIPIQQSRSVSSQHCGHFSHMTSCEAYYQFGKDEFQYGQFFTNSATVTCQFLHQLDLAMMVTDCIFFYFFLLQGKWHQPGL